MFTYNTSVHEGTKFTTHELLYEKFARARSVDTSFDKMRKVMYDAHLRGLQPKIFKSFDRARVNHNETLFRSKTYYDRKTRRKLLPGSMSTYLKMLEKASLTLKTSKYRFLCFRILR